jgi:predicted nucleic acid-binding protein
MTIRRVILDTDVASRILRDRLRPDLAVTIGGAEWVVSFATVGELWKWAEAKRWGPRRRAILDDWLADVVVVHSDDEIARRWGRSVGSAEARGWSRPTNDAWIAACCLARQLPLATLNVKDFAYHVEHDELVLVG